MDPLISALPDDALITAYNNMEPLFQGEPDDAIGSPFNQAQKYAALIVVELQMRGIAVEYVGLKIERAAVEAE